MTAHIASIVYTLPGQTQPVATVPPATTTTLPGSELTINNHTTVNIPGDKTDPADFYGIILVIAAIAIAIILTRLVFRRAGRNDEEQRR